MRLDLAADDDERWPPQHRERLVLTDGDVGLLDAGVRHALRERLDELMRNHS